MRHISFDESSVLKEYARIANEKGMVKTAQEVPQAREAPVTPPAESRTIEPIQTKPEQLQNPIQDFNLRLAKYPLLKAFYDNKGRANNQHLTNMFKQEITKGALKEMSRRNPDLARGLSDMVLNAYRMVLSREQFNRLSAFVPQTPATAPSQVATKASVLNAEDLEKQAEGRLYDISGETGEQLVDSAHPGGGTRTELTSKTDENLIETIVEQQKRDIEVARSVPKGTYAMLVKLHNQLEKMGHGDVLSPLKNAILNVASTEDIISGTLVSLADKLDRLGYERSANRVDSFFLKKAEEPSLLPTDQQMLEKSKNKLQELLDEFNIINTTGINAVIDNIIKDIKYVHRHNLKPIASLETKLNSLKGKKYFDAARELRSIKSTSAIMNIINKHSAPPFNKLFKLRKQMVAIQQQVFNLQKETPAGPAVSSKTEPKKRKSNPNVLKFQKGFNYLYKQLAAKIGDSNMVQFGKPLIEDGIWGAKTKAAHGYKKTMKDRMDAPLDSPAPPEFRPFDEDAVVRELFKQVYKKFQMTQDDLSMKGVILLRRKFRELAKTREAFEAYSQGRENTWAVTWSNKVKPEFIKKYMEK